MSRNRPGQVFQDAAMAPELVIVPSGSFDMGSVHYDELDIESTGPLHRVTLKRRLAFGKYPVTFSEFDYFISQSGFAYWPADASWGRGNRPVINVDWDHATAYCLWLSELTSEIYRLPSEAEWEYCCRSGTTSPFSFGDTISTEQANFDGNFAYGSGEIGEFRERTTSVDRFPANGFGLHDMHGNVSEWVQDFWNETYHGAPTDGSVWLAGDQTRHVVRGGTWRDVPDYLCCDQRDWARLTDRDVDLGFRIVRELA